MNAPSKVTPLQLDRAISGHIETHYLIRDGEYCCRGCGTQIDYATGNISVHDRPRGGCAGSGRMLNIALPYCLRCEGPPSQVDGCVHIRPFATTRRYNFVLAMLILAGSAALILAVGIVR